MDLKYIVARQCLQDVCMCVCVRVCACVCAHDKITAGLQLLQSELQIKLMLKWYLEVNSMQVPVDNSFVFRLSLQ
jgi:hypothetical protein